jgi:DnaJ-domain-containing protein 1
MSNVATILLAVMGLRFGLPGLVVGLLLGQMIDRSGWPLRIVHAVERALRIGGPRPAAPPPFERERPTRDPYETLGLDRARRPGAEEVQAAYRKLAQQYHPDRVNHLAPEFRALAERKFREITKARDLILGER